MDAAQIGTLLAAAAGVITAVTGLVKAVQANRKADAHAASTHDQVHPYPPAQADPAKGPVT